MHMPKVKDGLPCTLPALIAPQDNACHLCRALIHDGESILCRACQQELNRCRIHPLEAATCAVLPVTLVLSAYWHLGAARRLVHQLKYDHDSRAALPLAHGMCGVYAWHEPLLAVVDGVVAVPVHRSRLNVRGYSQAELLARAFCQSAALPYLPDALTRVHHSMSQIHRSRQERMKAMEHAFVACSHVSGMRLLLVDDVYTTGATAAACAQSLSDAGATIIAVLTAAHA